jgi:cardiolipin synthase
VPDESLQRALVSAARRGVDVTLIVPKNVDSRLVRLAGRPFMRELTSAGVKVAEYHAGMLHTKSITIDHDISFFGSLNLDPRSLNLNFELMLVIYDEAFTRNLIDLQREYVEHSEIMTTESIGAPSVSVRFAESCVRLVSPLL